MKKKISWFTKTVIAACLSLLIVVSAIPVKTQAIEPVTTVALIIFAGKVYAIGGRIVNGATAAASTAITKLTAEESEGVIKNFLESVDGRIDAAGHEAYAAKTTEDARKALNKQANFKILKGQYQDLLGEVQLNKNLTVVNIAKKEIKDQGVGFVLGELDVPDEAQGKGVSHWSLEQAIKLGGYEVTKTGGELLKHSFGLVKGIWQAGDNIIHNRIFGDVPLTAKDITEEDKELYKAFKEGRITKMKTAITKAQWDYFIKVTAKEEFKKHLRGEQSRFNKLPLSVQEKYWNTTWLMSDQINEIHEIMKKARETGHYLDAVKQIIEKYPKYAELFRGLTKDAVGDTKELLKKINQAYQKELEAQKEELKEMEREAEEARKKEREQQPTSQPSQESLPTTVEEVIDEAKKLSPQQTKSSCRQFIDNMCRGLCSNVSEGYDFCMQGCLGANMGSCNQLPD